MMPLNAPRLSVLDLPHAELSTLCYIAHGREQPSSNVVPEGEL